MLKTKLSKFVLVVLSVIMLLGAGTVNQTLGSENFQEIAVVTTAASSKTHLKKTKVTVTVGDTYTQKLINKKGKTISASKIKWKSANKKVAKISSDGKITAVKNGTVTMSATYKGKKFKFTVTIKKPTFKYKNIEIGVKDTVTQVLKSASGKSIKSTSVTWKSADTKIATVSKNGKITGKKKGKVKITATYKGKNYKFTVNVKKVKPSLTLNENEVNLYTNEKLLLTAIAVPTGAKIKWSSSDSNVATVDSKGNIKAINEGSATIKASITYKKKTYESVCKVNVEKTEATLALTVSEKYTTADKNSVAFQSFYDFCGGEISAEKTGDNHQKITYTAENYEKLKKYVEMLSSDNNINLTLGDDYYFSYKGQHFFSYGFTYTGSASITPEKSLTFAESDTKYAVEIWGSNASSKCIYVNWSKGMEYVDMGYRIDGNKVSSLPSGTSAAAGLTRYKDTYTTSDSRLSTTSGNAVIIRNGVKSSAEAGYYYDSEKKTETLTVNYFGNKKIKVFMPTDATVSGEIYEFADLAETNKVTYSTEPALKVDKTTLVVGDESWLKPSYKTDDIDEVTLRIMYRDEKRAVFYIYFDNDSFDDGSEVEILCVADIAKAKADEQQRIKDAQEQKEKEEQQQQSSGSSSGGSSGTSSGSFPSTNGNRCTFCGGSGTRSCLTCGGSGYKTDYVSVPNYSGSTSGSGSGYVTKKCPSVTCRNGRVNCSYCGGDGVR